jgi:single-strand DNA-binding protein
MNKVILIGHIAADPESRTTNSGVAQCNLRLAVQRRFANAQGQREADFFQVVCWRNTAEFAAKYLAKGRRVAVEGSLQTRSYDAQDGSKRYVTEIIADNVEFCDSNPSAQHGAQEAREPFPTNRNAEGFAEVEDDELPF